MARINYSGYRFPPAIIQKAIWLYVSREIANPRRCDKAVQEIRSAHKAAGLVVSLLWIPPFRSRGVAAVIEVFFWDLKQRLRWRIEMTKRSAGILLFRRMHGSAQVLLIHPGGPYWRGKDEGTWSIPKGLLDEGEEPLSAAKREFLEETGTTPQGLFIALGDFRLSSDKCLTIWALEGDFDLASFKSNTFRMEWPPNSARFEDFPEADRAEWFDAESAARKITKGQRPILDALFRLLSSTRAWDGPYADQGGALETSSKL
jgi:predicted NUDIX family NTP pyrophosphohydrolase